MLNQLTFRQLKNALEETQHLPRSLFAETKSPERWRKARADRKYADYWAKLEEQAAQLIQEPARSPQFSEFTVFGDTGDVNKFGSKFRHLFAGIHTFSMLAMTEDRTEWMTGLNNTMWSVCNEYTWVLPEHVGLYHNDYPNGIWDQPVPPRETVDLFAAYSACHLAEAISLHGDRLHPWVVHRVKEEIERRIFQVYFHSPLPQNWELKTNNWPAVCASSIGAAAIYLVEDREKLAGMLWRVIGVLRGYLSGFDEEGATPEGPTYWSFGFSWFVYFAELLKEITHGRISLLSDEKVKAISEFPQFCTLSGGKVVNFSDSFESIQFNPGLIHRLQHYAPSLHMPAEEYRIAPGFINWVDAARLMLWSPDSYQEELAEEQARVEEKIFTGTQWVISKVRRQGGRMAAFAAKGGYNEEPHNHNDLGHFILHVDGENVLADIGIGVYTKQYFQPQYRYELINAGSHGHSVPIVNGCKQGFGKQFRSEILYSQITENEVQFGLDLTKAYACDSLELLTREFIWRRPEDENPQLVITDKASFSKVPESFQEVFISSVPPQEEELGHIQMNAVMMHYDSDQWKVDIERIVTDVNSKQDVPFYRIILTLKNPELEVAFSCRIEIAES